MSSIRKKRNFKGLQLNDSPLSVPAPQPSASGTALGKSSTSSSSSSLAGSSSNATTSAATSNNTLTLGSSTTAGTRGGAVTGSGDVVEPSSGANYHNTLTEQLKNLELGVEYKLDLKNEDLKVLSELGSGNGGTVTRVLHEKSNTVMARKTVFIDAKPAVRKQILRELQILHECNSPYIVSFYGAYLSEPHICMCMEFMDKSSLDTIWKKWGPIPADICGLVAVTVVQGLTYLYDVHRIIHRDVKPSNILVNAKGEIKICDFGVSGELINSIADTFVGTSTYMSPERIQGDQYSVKSDVWSLGITIIEIALGRFPFAEDDEENDDGDSEDSDDDSDDDDTEGDEDSDDHLRTTLSPTKPNGARDNANMQRTATLAATASSSKEKKTHRRRRSKKKPGVSLAGGAGQMSMLELLQRIVNEPPPRLPIAPSVEEEEGGSSEDVTIDSSAARTQQRRQRQHRRTRRPRGFPPDLVRFVDLCVTKDPSARPTPKELASGVGAVGEYVRRCEERRERGETDVKGWVDGLH